jgi:hypothetical protein
MQYKEDISNLLFKWFMVYLQPMSLFCGDKELKNNIVLIVLKRKNITNICINIEWKYDGLLKKFYTLSFTQY